MAGAVRTRGEMMAGLICVAWGLLFGETAVAQQFINPTVLAPVSRETLPRGTVKVVPPKTGEAPAPQGAKARNGRDRRNAVPIPSVQKNFRGRRSELNAAYGRFDT